ncbi:MAG TPA: TIGR03618 family F420-dependent PPOX class oxidoreductase [Acidimicrobiia bacterium]|nr:TIGR03618 family F420-dependent PPOX class oxidoreductase [Acidimicrobiia bacterium]
MLDPLVAELAKAENYAAVTTLMPDGTPQTHMMWVDATDTHLFVNTEIGRQKYRNVVRDPRITVMIMDRNDPYRFAEVRGRVVGELAGKAAADHINQLAKKYTGEPYWNPADKRVIIKIAPVRTLIHR